MKFNNFCKEMMLIDCLFTWLKSNMNFSLLVCLHIFSVFIILLASTIPRLWKSYIQAQMPDNALSETPSSWMSADQLELSLEYDQNWRTMENVDH